MRHIMFAEKYMGVSNILETQRIDKKGIKRTLYTVCYLYFILTRTCTNIKYPETALHQLL